MYAQTGSLTKNHVSKYFRVHPVAAADLLSTPDLEIRNALGAA